METARRTLNGHILVRNVFFTAITQKPYAATVECIVCEETLLVECAPYATPTEFDQEIIATEEVHVLNRTMDI